jgi:hypothetical protein
VAEADRLAERLGDVPMALDLAAALRAATGWSVDDYLNHYQRRSDELTFPSPVRVAWGLAPDGHPVLARVAAGERLETELDLPPT